MLFADASQFNGFLPTRGTIMLDFVFLAMFGIVPIMAFSIYLVRYRQKYELHKRLQVILGLTLLAAVTAFEVDMRFFTDWEELAEPSAHYQAGEWNTVWYSLIVHLAFAIPTAFLWIFVIVQGLRRFPSPAMPNDYSRVHLFWARLSAIGMTMTAVTGWIFYWLAFVA